MRRSLHETGTVYAETCQRKANENLRWFIAELNFNVSDTTAMGLFEASAQIDHKDGQRSMALLHYSAMRVT